MASCQPFGYLHYICSHWHLGCFSSVESSPLPNPPPQKKNPCIYLSHFKVSKVFWYLLKYGPQGGCMRWVDWVNQEHRLSFTRRTVGCYRVAVKPRSLSPSSFLPWILLQMNYLTPLFIFALVWRKLKLSCAFCSVTW